MTDPASARELPAVVDASEDLYRRLLPGWYNPKKDPAVPQRAFEPRPWQSEEKQGDTDGVSVIRALKCRLTVACVRPDNGKNMQVARVSGRVPVELRITVRCDPDAESSHALLAELNSISMKESEDLMRWIKESALKLAKASILVHDGNGPTDPKYDV